MNSTGTELANRWIRSRKVEAFNEIVSRYADMVFATCTRILRNRADAEDVTQQCFLELAKTDKLVETSIGGWLHSLATSRSINFAKSDSKRRQREQRYAEMTNQHDEVEWDDMEGQVDAAIGALPEKLRVVIVGHFLERRTHEAVAKELQISRSAVTRRITKAIEVMRKSLAKCSILVTAALLSAALKTRMAEAAPSHLTASLGKLVLASATSSLPVGSGAGLFSKTFVTGGFLAMKTPAIAIGLSLVGVVGLWMLMSLEEPEPNVLSTGMIAEVTREPSMDSGNLLIATETPQTNGESEQTEMAGSSVLDLQNSNQVSPQEDTSYVETPAGALIFGKVVDAQGNPVVGTNVTILGTTSLRRGATAVTDEEGLFRLEDVSPTAECFLYAFLPGRMTRSLQHSLSSLVAGEEHELLLTLYEGIISGRVVDENHQPLVDVDVLAQPTSAFRFGFPTTRTGSSGTFSITGLFPDTYDLQINLWRSDAPWLSTGESVTLEANEVVDGIILVAKEPEGGSMSGWISDPDGLAVSGARVSVNMPVFPYGSQWAKSNEDGYYLVSGLEDGVYNVQVTHREYGFGFQRNIPAGGEEINFTLQPRGGVAGIVLNALTHQPVSRYSILEHIPISDTHPEFTRERWREVEDDQGRFLVESLRPGDNHLVVRADGFGKTEHKVEVLPGEITEEVTIFLNPGREIEGIVTDVEENPVAGALIFAGLLPSKEKYQSDALGRSVGDGSFLIQDLPSSTETITIYHHAYATSWMDVDAATDSLSVILKEGGIVEGTVLLDGSPSPAFHVGVTYLEHKIGPTTAAPPEADGSFRIPRINSQEVVIFASIRTGKTTGSRLRYRTLKIEESQTVRVDFDFATHDTLLKGLVTSEGKPRPGLSFAVTYDYGNGLTEVVNSHLTDAGEFYLTGLPSGPCTITIFPPGVRSPDEAVNIACVIEQGGITRQDIDLAQ